MRHTSLLRQLLAPVGIVLSTIAASGSNSTFAQQITIDFRFDDNSAGANPTTKGQTTVTLAPGTAGQTYLVDVWATVSGGSSPNMNGLKDVSLRGISNITTATSAFATGATIGAVTGTANFQYFAPFNAGAVDADHAAHPNVRVSDLGSTSAALAGDTTNSANGVLDGILDFGGTVSSQVFGPLSFTNGAVFGSYTNDGAAGKSPTPNGVAVGSNAYTWQLGTFKFTTGAASSAAGSTTMFWPAAAKSTGGGDISTNGQPGTTNLPVTVGTPLTFTVGGVAAGTTITVTPGPNASVLKGGIVGLAASINNTGSTALASSDYTFAASGGTAISYTAMPSQPIAAGGTANFSTTAGTTAGPAGTPIGNATVTFTVPASAAITNSPQSASLTLNVGGATANNSNTAGVYGASLTAPVGPGGSYAGLESAVVGVQGTGGSNAVGANFLGGHATILAGINNNANPAKTVSMQWRTRLQPSEAPGTKPPLPPGTTTGLSSDVLNLTGLENGAGTTTDPYVLDMSYNPAFLPKGGPPAIEQGLVNNKLLYMVSPVGADGTPYVNAVALNTGNVVISPLDSRYGYHGSYAAFQADALGGNGGTPGSELGAWGVDIGSHEVWAVLNHNSTFAVVPEPATILLAGLGLLGIVAARRRYKK